LRFGKIQDSDIKPGIHFRWPAVDEIQIFDKRIQTMDANPESYLTIEKKNLIVDSFVKWRIGDGEEAVNNYFVTVRGTKQEAERRLAQRVNDSLREEVGRRTVQEVISGDRAKIMNVVREKINEQAKGIGVDVVDVRLKRVDWDPEISERVYKRMEAERERVAKELRAKGSEEAEKIRADADRQRQIILAEAYRDSEQLRGEGDATATKIYADAFGQDAEFYNLYRSLTAYKNTFNSPDDLLVVEPKSEFFRYFNNARPGPTPAIQ
jgi:membrane protease subunit HflC